MNRGFLDGMRKMPPPPIVAGPYGPTSNYLLGSGRYMGIVTGMPTTAEGYQSGDWVITSGGHPCILIAVFGLLLWVDGRTINAGEITRAMEVNQAANSIRGNNTGAGAVPIDLTVAQVKALLAYVAADIPTLAALTGATFTGLINNSGASGGLSITGASAQLGFSPGAGGAVTQLTSRVTGVALARPSGAITLFAATALAADTTTTFVLTNALIAANDQLICSVKSGAAVPGAYAVTARCGAGSASIDVHNVTPTASAAETPVIQYTILKGAIA